MDPVEAWKKRLPIPDDVSGNQLWGFVKYISYVNAEVAAILTKYFYNVRPRDILIMAWELTGRDSCQE